MRRVVVTGLGAVSPLGTGVKKNWDNAIAGKSGIRLLESFDTTDFAVKIAGEVPDFNCDDFIPKKDQKKMSRFIHLAMAASIEAMEDSGLVIDDSNAEKVGVYIGCGIGGLADIQKWYDVIKDKGPSRVSPFFLPAVLVNMASGNVSIKTGAKGPNNCSVTACATGTHCIGDAARAIERGDADAMIAGSSESTVCETSVAGFNAMKALSTNNDNPSGASRPFDKGRDGFVIGEGAGIVILEELESAKKRGAKIYGEVVGYGASGDAHHMTTPSPNGAGAARCMQMALDDAKMNANEIDYINAHGTSTYYNDLYETMAIKTVYGDYANKVDISSTKSMTGHLLGAAGSLEAVFGLKAMEDSVIPPTINYETPDEGCDLNYTPNKAKELTVNSFASNSFGFGGTNAVLVFKKI